MIIALCGATGKAGSRILNELTSRGHQVTAVVRQDSALAARPDVKVAIDNLTELTRLANTLHGAGALVSAYAPPPDALDELPRVTQPLTDAVAPSGVPSLPDGRRSRKSRGCARHHPLRLRQATARVGRNRHRACPCARPSPLFARRVDFTLAGSIYFDLGERTGNFRLGTDNLIVDANGDSRISMEDYAIALVDELEHPSASGRASPWDISPARAAPDNVGSK